jgi:hypothetical protein
VAVVASTPHHRHWHGRRVGGSSTYCSGRYTQLRRGRWCSPQAR